MIEYGATASRPPRDLVRAMLRGVAGRCPNCGGELVRRPVRLAAMLAKYPASTERVTKPHAGCGRAA